MHKFFSIFLIAIMLTSTIASSSFSQNVISSNPAFAEKGGTENITICHVPPGNPDNEHPITVSEKALDAHLKHGDTIGTCPSLLAEEYLELISELDELGNNLGNTEITQELIDKTANDLSRLKEIVIELQNIGYDGEGTVSRINDKSIGNVVFYNENTGDELFNIDIPDGTLAIFAIFGLIAEFDGTPSEFTLEEKISLLNDSLSLVDVLTNFDDEEIANTFVLSAIGAFHPSTEHTFIIVGFLIQYAIITCLAHPECLEAVNQVVSTAVSLLLDNIFPIVFIVGSEFNDLNGDGIKSGSGEVGVGGFEYELFLQGASGGFISENPTISDSEGKFSFQARIPSTVSNTIVIQSDREGWESTTGNFVEKPISDPSPGRIFPVYIDAFGNQELMPPNHETVLFDDDFSTGLDGWTKYSIGNSLVAVPNPIDNYSLLHDLSDGQSAPSALISGDGYAINVGMKKQFTIPEGTTQVTLTFNGKAQGTLPSHEYIPNLLVSILDENNQNIYNQYVVGPGNPSSVSVTPWETFTLDITDQVNGHSQVSVVLGLADSWIVNYSQKAWFDNVSVKISSSSNPESSLDNVWQYREHNRISAFPPDYTFTKLSTGDKPLHITSTVAGAGDSYVFKTFKKSDIEDHDLKITWSGTSPVVSGVNQWGFILADGAYDRTSFEDFPVNEFRVSKGSGDLELIDLQVVEFGPQTDILSPDWTSSPLEDVTVFVRVTDSGTQRSVTGTVNSIEIVGVATWIFEDPVINPEQTGTTDDYGTYSATCIGCS